MKSVYYGQKFKTVAETGGWGHYDHIFMRNRTIEEITKLIEDAHLNKEEKTDRFTIKRLVIQDNEVFLMDKDVSYDSEIGDSIEIRGKKGKVLNKKYDVTNDTMYYYTDIVVFIDESDYKESKIRALNYFIQLAEQYLEQARYKEDHSRRNKIHEMFLEKERLKAEEEQNKTFIGKIINWFKG